MSWDDIRYFLAVMRGGSLSAAARAAGSALDGRAAHRRAGVRARHPAVRPAAARMAADRRRAAPCRARGTHRNRRACVRARRLRAAALDGVVRVSASPVFASHFLAPRLARAQRAWPALRIDLLGEMHAANLYAREADLAVRLSRPTEPGRRAPARHDALRAVRVAGMGGRAARHLPFVGYDDALAQTPQHQWLARFAAGRRFAFVTNDLPRSIARARPAPASRCCRGFRRRAGRACRRAARRADGRTALRHRARDLARGPPGRAPVAARAACRRRDRRSRSRGGRTAVGSCLRTRLCHARQRPA